jgi:hypothetical protein
MTKINFGRLFIGGLIATVLLFLSDGFLHEQVFKQYWEYLYQGLGATPARPGHAYALVYFFIFELGRGFGANLYLCADAAVPWCRAEDGRFRGDRGVARVLGNSPAEFIPLGFYGRRLWVMVAAAQLVTSIVANLIAAWIYRDPATTATPAE